MTTPLSFRPVGKACFFGDRGPELTAYLTAEFGELPVTITQDDIPKLEEWYVNQGGELPVRGVLGMLIHQINEFQRIEVGYFDVG